MNKICCFCNCMLSKEASNVVCINQTYTTIICDPCYAGLKRMRMVMCPECGYIQTRNLSPMRCAVCGDSFAVIDGAATLVYNWRDFLSHLPRWEKTCETLD